MGLDGRLRKLERTARGEPVAHFWSVVRDERGEVVRDASGDEVLACAFTGERLPRREFERRYPDARTVTMKFDRDLGDDDDEDEG